ncbi:MAG TPA: DUF2993 domain-containing protein [Actinocrinis sp.]
MTAANPDDHDRFYGSPPPPRPADPPDGAAPGRAYREPTYQEPSGGGYPSSPPRGYSNYSERAPEPTYAQRAPEPTLRYEAPEPTMRRGEPPEYAPSTPSPSAGLPPPRKRRRWVRRLAITLGILLVLLVAADRVSVIVAQNVAATQVQKEQNLPQKPGISIKGFPFLTQVASRDFSHIAVDIHGLQSTGVPITDLHADLYGVHVDSSFNGGTADTVNAVAQLSYSAIDTAVNQQIEQGFGQVTVSEGTGNQLQASFTVLGVSVSASVSITVAPNNTIDVKSGQVNSPLSGLLNLGNTSFSTSFQLKNLPFGIQLNGIQVTKNYVGVTATGHNVPLQASSSNG